MKTNKRVIITGGDGEYLKMTEVMIRSILDFSDPLNSEFDFRVYSFNCDYFIEGVECIRINLPYTPSLSQSDPINITQVDFSSYWGKYYATIHSLKDYEFSVWVDSDSFLTPVFNRVWDYCSTAKNKKHPLFLHYFLEDTDYWFKMSNSEIEIRGKYGSELSHMFNIIRNPFNKLAAAGLYIAHENHIDFLKECLEIWYESMRRYCYYYADDKAFSEERITNLCLWKYRYNDFLPFTWINAHTEKNLDRFTDTKIRNILLAGFDVMFDERDNSIFSIHGPNKFRLEKNSENLKLIYNAFLSESDKLMIVSHPDDELIFGGSALLEENGWRVICLTNGSNKIRMEEFIDSLHLMCTLDYVCYDLPDILHSPLDESDLDSILRKEISSKKWNKIVTHNNIGEYGHPHHYQVHQKVKSIIGEENLWVFDKQEEESGFGSKKYEILEKIYTSQMDIISQIRENRGRWFIDKNMETNYIDHGVVVRYLESSTKNQNFIPCYLK